MKIDFKKALVTGGCGFIGSHLVDKLLSTGCDVIVIDNLSTGRLENLKHHKDNNRCSVLVYDLNDTQLNLREIVSNVEAVFHLAALADIVPSVDNPEKYFHSNVLATLKILEACRGQSHLKKFLYAASSSCYGIPEIYPTPESAPINPEYPYALTKRMGEELVLHWGKLYKIPVISTRFFNVYGPRFRTSGTYGAVFGVFLAQKLAKKPLTIVGDGHQTRDFIFVSDVVDALIELSHSHYHDEVFNVGSGNHYPINKLVELIQGEKVHIPKRPAEPDCTYGDITKIKKLTNWTPKVDFESGVNIMLSKIDDWKDAPVWSVDQIAEVTKSWFENLKQ